MIIIILFESLNYEKQQNIKLLQVSAIPRRQLFLHRNVRTFKLQNVLPKADTATTVTKAASSSTETITDSVQKEIKVTSDDSSVVVNSTVVINSSAETTSSVVNDTVEVTSNTNDAPKNSQSATTISTATTVTTTISESTISSEANVDGNVLLKNQSKEQVWNKRPLERVGAGCNEGYIIDDRSEFNIQKYRMIFVLNKDAVFYKKNAFRQAKKVSF